MTSPSKMERMLISIMRDMMSIILEGTLEEELDEELGYSKYDYKNKETTNSRKGYSKKTMYTSYGDMEIEIPRDCEGDMYATIFYLTDEVLGWVKEKIWKINWLYDLEGNTFYKILLSTSVTTAQAKKKTTTKKK